MKKLICGLDTSQKIGAPDNITLQKCLHLPPLPPFKSASLTSLSAVISAFQASTTWAVESRSSLTTTASKSALRALTALTASSARLNSSAPRRRSTASVAVRVSVGVAISVAGTLTCWTDLDFQQNENRASTRQFFNCGTWVGAYEKIETTFKNFLFCFVVLLFCWFWGFGVSN